MEGIPINTWLTIIGMFTTAQVTIIASVWVLQRNINKEVTNIYTKIQATLDKMLEKLEYHEKHDDGRFGQLNDGLWEIRLQNAALNPATVKGLTATTNAVRERPTT